MKKLIIQNKEFSLESFMEELNSFYKANGLPDEIECNKERFYSLMPNGLTYKGKELKICA